MGPAAMGMGTVPARRRYLAKTTLAGGALIAGGALAQPVLPSFTYGPGIQPTLPTAPATGAPDAPPPGFVLTPGLRTVAGYTTNVDRSPPGQEPG